MKVRRDSRSSHVWAHADELRWFVYTFYDSAGVALYVGCTSHLEQRIRSHGPTIKWWRPEATRVGVLGPFAREMAHDLESTLIAARDPIGNKVGTNRNPLRRHAFTPPLYARDMLAHLRPADEPAEAAS